MFAGWARKLKALVSEEAGDNTETENQLWTRIHADYLSLLTPGPFQRAVAGGDVELARSQAGIIACGPYSSKPVLTRNSGR